MSRLNESFRYFDRAAFCDAQSCDSERKKPGFVVMNSIIERFAENVDIMDIGCGKPSNVVHRYTRSNLGVIPLRHIRFVDLHLDLNREFTKLPMFKDIKFHFFEMSAADLGIKAANGTEEEKLELFGETRLFTSFMALHHILADDLEKFLLILDTAPIGSYFVATVPNPEIYYNPVVAANSGISVLKIVDNVATIHDHVTSTIWADPIIDWPVAISFFHDSGWVASYVNGVGNPVLDLPVYVPPNRSPFSNAQRVLAMKAVDKLSFARIKIPEKLPIVDFDAPSLDQDLVPSPQYMNSVDFSCVSATPRNYWFAPKLDGIRGFVEIYDDGMRITTAVCSYVRGDIGGSPHHIFQVELLSDVEVSFYTIFVVDLIKAPGIPVHSITFVNRWMYMLDNVDCRFQFYSKYPISSEEGMIIQPLLAPLTLKYSKGAVRRRSPISYVKVKWDAPHTCYHPRRDFCVPYPIKRDQECVIVQRELEMVYEDGIVKASFGDFRPDRQKSSFDRLPSDIVEMKELIDGIDSEFVFSAESLYLGKFRFDTLLTNLVDKFFVPEFITVGNLLKSCTHTKVNARCRHCQAKRYFAAIYSKQPDAVGRSVKVGDGVVRRTRCENEKHKPGSKPEICYDCALYYMKVATHQIARTDHETLS